MDNKIVVVKGEKSWIESNAMDQLKNTANLRGVIKAVGLPDLHAGKTPVGASFVTWEILYPHIVGNDIGCGMALFSTGIKKGKFKLARVMDSLENLGGLDNIDISRFTDKTHFPFKEKLGTIGSGNHFAEFQEIDRVFDEDALNSINIDRGTIYLLVHSGSRSYGEFILRKYIDEYSCQNGLEKGAQAFEQYLSEHEDAVNFASLNRELIAYRLLSAVNGKCCQKVLDSVHNSITKKIIDGKEFFIHRKGAAPSDMGCVVVAGTRGSKSYIVKPSHSLMDYGFSISHGAGRKWARFGCRERLENIYSKKSVRQNNLTSNLIFKDKSVIYEEAPEAYKNIERVIEDMMDEKMITLVASLKPLITYKV